MESHQHISTEEVVLECKGIGLSYKSEHSEPVEAISNINLSVQRNEIVSVIGPSGCGKSSLLSVISGLQAPTKGHVIHEGKIVTQPSFKRSMVFQQPHLFPWANVYSNIEWGLKRRNVEKKKREEKVKRILSDIGLSKWAKSYPHELSVGMKMRVAVGRALAQHANLLLMDEPFAALDYQTRLLMQKFMLGDASKRTILLVTHSIDEALLADRVIVLSQRPGRIIDEVKVGLVKPIDPTAKKYIQLKTYLANKIQEEVMKSVNDDGSWPSAVRMKDVWKHSPVD